MVQDADGQLVPSFLSPQIDREFEGERILAIFGGFGHIFVINDTGKLAHAGPKGFVQQKLPPDAGGVRQVACGEFHIAFIVDGGGLYTCGDNSFGQLGYTSPGAQDAVPRPVVAFARLPVTAVACGQHHTACITAQGDVYTWGRGMEGQLGHGRLETSPSPRYVKALAGQPAATVAAGWLHTAAVTAAGRLYTWGDDTALQLGVGRDGAAGGSGRRTVPTEVALEGGDGDEEGDVAVEGVGCGWGHTVCVTRSGAVWSFGLNRHGQLGHGTVDAAPLPRRVEALRGVAVRAVRCGGHVTAALTRGGRLFVWGSGAHGRLGRGSEADGLVPAACEVAGRLFAHPAACRFTQARAARRGPG